MVERTPLSIKLFGPLDVAVDGRPLTPLRTSRERALLGLLALRGDMEVDRAWLAGTLWPDSLDEHAAYNLRRALSDLRRALGPAANRLRSGSPRTLVLDPETGKERIDPAASARDAAEWFASPWGLAGMRDVWRQKGCKAGRDIHGDEPTPSLEQVIRQHAVRNARRQRPASPSSTENRQ